MKKTFLLSVLLAASLAAQSRGLSPDQALSRAQEEASASPSKAAPGSHSTATQFNLVHTASMPSGLPGAYVFADQRGRIIIASASDKSNALLGYADSPIPLAEQPFDKTGDPCPQLPENMIGWLQSMADAISLIEQKPSAFSCDEWNRHGMPTAKGNRGQAAQTGDGLSKAPYYPAEIPPLMTSKWSQYDPYNRMTPESSPGAHCPTGCVATAISQVLRYHQHPSQGAGVGKYTFNGTTYNVDISGQPYDWDSMLDEYKAGKFTEEQGNAVALLMAHAGAAAQMSYTASAGASYATLIASALAKHFSIDRRVFYAERSCHPGSKWDQLIQDQLRNVGPVIMSASSSKGGHSYVIDGRSSDGLYHVNWGWGGQCDGYYAIDVMNPYDESDCPQGFVRGQSIIGGIQPAGSPEAYRYGELEVHTLSFPKVSVVGKETSFTMGVYNFSNEVFYVSPGIRLTNLSSGETIEFFEGAQRGYSVQNPMAMTPGQSTITIAIPDGVSDGEYKMEFIYKTAEGQVFDMAVPDKASFPSSYYVAVGGGVFQTHKAKPTSAAWQISLDNATLEIAYGESATLAASTVPSTIDPSEIIWISTDPSIASVDNGIVTAQAGGETDIIAANGLAFEKCHVIVHKRHQTIDWGNEIYEGNIVHFSHFGLPRRTIEGLPVICKVVGNDAPYETYQIDNLDVEVIFLDYGCVTIEATAEGNAQYEPLEPTTITIKYWPSWDPVVITPQHPNVEIKVGEGFYCQGYYSDNPKYPYDCHLEPADTTIVEVAPYDDRFIIGVSPGQTDVYMHRGILRYRHPEDIPGVMHVTVLKYDQTIKWAPSDMPELSDLQKGDVIRLRGASDRCLPLSFAVASGNEVATVEDGLLKILEQGEFTLEARQDGDDKTAAAKPVSFQLSAGEFTGRVCSVFANPEEAILAAGETLQLSAAVYPEGASYDAIEWTSSDPSVATVDSDGLVTAVSGGEASITASSGGKSSTSLIKVGQQPQTLSWDQKFDEPLIAGDKIALEAKASSGLDVEYAVIEGSEFASVSCGVLEVTGGGTFTIEASQPGSKAYFAAETLRRTLRSIDLHAPVESIDLSQQSLSLTIGGQASLSCKLSPDYVIDKAVVWASSDPSVASVDSEGVVSAVGAGNATITASCDNARAECQVEVSKKKQYISWAQDFGEPLIGDALPLSATASSGLEVDFSIASGDDFACIVANVLTVTGAGEVTVCASQAGSDEYEAAFEYKTFTTVDPVTHVQSVKLSETVLLLCVGESTQLSAAVSPSDATYPDVAWSISDPLVAIVDNFGAVTALSEGVATITATAEGVEAKCYVSVSLKEQEISWDQEFPAEPVEGDVFELSASSSSGLPVSYAVLSGPARIIEPSTLEVTGAGRIEIEASCAGNGEYDAAAPVKKSLTAKAKIVLAERVELSDYSLELTIGDSYTLAWTVFPDNATDKSVEFASSNASAATVDASGKVTAVGAGEAVITASCGQAKAECRVIVSKLAQQIAWSQQADGFVEGQTIELTATASSGLEVEYEITAGSNIASIQGNRLTAIAPGRIAVKATQKGDDRYAAADPVEMEFNAQAGLGDALSDAVSIRVEGSELIVEGLPLGSEIAVYDVGGNLLYAGSPRPIAVQSGKAYIVATPNGTKKILATR